MGRYYNVPGRCPRCLAPMSAQRRKTPLVRDIADMTPWSQLDCVDGVWCPSCRRGFRVEEFECDDMYVYSWGDPMEAVPRWCPFCRAELEVNR